VAAAVKNSFLYAFADRFFSYGFAYCLRRDYGIA